MDSRTRNFILLLVGTAALPFIAQSAFAGPDQKDLAIDAVNLGLTGTLIGVPIILFMSTRFSVPVTAVTLTAVGLGLKFLLLPHGEHEAIHDLADEELVLA